MLAFNVLEYTDNLEKTGVKPETARVHAEALISASEEQRDFIHKELATKSDLKSDTKDLKYFIELQFEKINSKIEKTDSKIEASKYFIISTVLIAIFGLVPFMVIFTKYLMKTFNL